MSEWMSMGGSYLLDTNVAIQILNQQIDLEALRGRGIEALLCLTVVGELLFGAEKSGRPEKNRLKIENLLELCPVAPQDVDTAKRYASLKSYLQQQGRPIPENDLWIAASALQNCLILATRDHHFDDIPGLETAVW